MKSEKDEKTVMDSSTGYPLAENPTKGKSHVIFAPIDTNAVVKNIESYITSPVFGSKYYPDGIGDIYTEERPIIYGDINGDNQADILMPFTIEGAGGGNHYEVYYAIMIRDKGDFKIVNVFERGIKSSDYMIVFDTVKNGVIKGWRKPGFHMANKDSTTISYQFNNGKLKELAP